MMKDKISKRTMKCILVILGVIILPLLYSYFYLGAFWDPYSSLETLPVAVVNNDKGAVINGKDRNIGQEMCDELKEDGSLKFVFTDEADAKEGTEENQYYAMITIPGNFSEDVASASATDKHTSTITYSSNQKRNYIASQILSKAVLKIEESTRSSINKEIVQTLTDKLNSVPDQMADLQDGLGELYDGSSKLEDGAQKLADGTKTFHDKLNEYKAGVSDAKSGSAELTDGAKSLNGGMDQLVTGADQLVTATKNIDKITSGSQTLATSMDQYNQSIKAYTTGVDSLIGTVNSTVTFLSGYVQKNPSLLKDPTFVAFLTKMSDPSNAKNLQTLQAAGGQLRTASQQLLAGTQQLQAGTSALPQLRSSLKQLSTGMKTVKAGTSTLYAGSQTLYSGLTKLDNATGQLSNGSEKIMKNMTKLSNGTTELKDGIKEAQDGVNSSVTDTNTDLKALDGLSDYADSPVTFEEDNINPVPNYGTAFAPYFMSLSLYVGGLIMFVGIYLDADGKFKLLSRSSEHKILRSLAYLLIGFAQAIALGLVVQKGLGLQINNTFLYYASCCLVSVVFISIVQFLFVYLKDVGKFLAIAFLILQLTSCGGTFPMETVPKLFNVMYPYMPMTYSVGLFKQAISGVDNSAVSYNIGILCAILAVFMALTIVLAVIHFKKPQKEQKLVEETV